MQLLIIQLSLYNTMLIVTTVITSFFVLLLIILIVIALRTFFEKVFNDE